MIHSLSTLTVFIRRRTETIHGVFSMITNIFDRVHTRIIFLSLNVRDHNDLIPGVK